MINCTVLRIAGFLTCLALARAAAGDQTLPTLAGKPIAPNLYAMLEKAGFLPLRPAMTDLELAMKFDLTLPQMTAVRTAVETNDAKGVEKALADYLKTRLPAHTFPPTGKPARDAAAADRWLKDEIEVSGRKYPIGEKINWWENLGPGAESADSGPGYAGFGMWGHPLTTAYADTGDPKYAQAMLAYSRSFYHQARPFAKVDWDGHITFLGPWHGLTVSGRIMPAYAPSVYQYIGNYSGMTDADRVMFLKIFWEATDWCHQLLGTPREDNHVVHVLTGTIYMTQTFPEFKDAKLWSERIGQRYISMMAGVILDDGGAFERTGYHYAYHGPFAANYRVLTASGFALPGEFRQGLKRMFDWNTAVLAPTQEFPMFGHGNIGPMNSVSEHGVAIFPERADFAYVGTSGQQGTPPPFLARVLPHTGWLTMRSSWNRDAQYLAFSFNGTPAGTDGHQDLFSFGLWSGGAPLMTNSGTTSPYGTPEENINEDTISANTVRVDEQTQGRMDNGGRLETWASLPASEPGVTYLAAVSRVYQRLGVSHRRAVLFVRPGYWVMYDVLSGDGKPHQYEWLGHFQPTQLSIDPNTGAIGTTAQENQRLWLVPASPSTLSVTEKSLPMDTRDGNAPPPLSPRRKMAPYVSLRQPNRDQATAFSVLLCPSTAEAPPPIVETLDASEQGRALPPAEATGMRIRQGSRDDIVALSVRTGTDEKRTRSFGNVVVSDAEATLIRRIDQKLTELALIGGTRLEESGGALVTCDPGITAVHVRYVEDRAQVTAEGRGAVVIFANAATKATVNGNVVNAAPENKQFKFQVGQSGDLALSAPAFANDAASLTRAIGLPQERSPGVLARNGKDAVVIFWETQEPADASVEYQLANNGLWLRSVNPEPGRRHRFVISGLTSDRTYTMRAHSRAGDGRSSTAIVQYHHREEGTQP